MFSRIGAGLYNIFLDHQDPIEFQATPANLKHAIKDKRERVLYYTFKEGSRSYSPLEYAIKSGEHEAVATLLSFAAEVPDFQPEPFVYFYIECLNEHSPPYLEILTSLLNAIQDSNVSKTDSALTMLEYALKHMAPFTQKQWHLINLLLQKGARITDVYGTTPFGILRDSQNAKIESGVMERTINEEILFLNDLESYLVLEKSYHPDSESALSVEEFHFHTSNLSACLSALLLELSQSYPDDYPLKRRPDEARYRRQSVMISAGSWNSRAQDFLKLKGQLEYLQGKFKTLVAKDADSKELLTKWQLTTCLAILEKAKDQYTSADELLKHCHEWGLVDEI